MTAPLSKSSPILVLGAGVFGLSTAFSLCKNGYTSILVADRVLCPVPDGSSVDISRIIRADYSDGLYVALAREAMSEWRNPSHPCSPAFHPCPFVLAVERQAGRAAEEDVPGPGFLRQVKSELAAFGLKWTDLSDGEALKKAFPALRGTCTGDGYEAYVNYDAGWADAAHGIGLIRDACVAEGVTFVTGAQGTATELLYEDNGAVLGAQTLSGTPLLAPTVILATGAWTGKLCPELGRSALTGTAQVMAFIETTAEERAELKSLPIYINLSSGFFVFPVHEPTGLLKVGCHGFGYTNTDSQTGVSTPPFPLSPQHKTPGVPAEGLQRLREGLRRLFPGALAERDFARKAVCWYTETPRGDYVMDRHPAHDGLWVATGGSGHAYKMLPVLGECVVKALEGRLEREKRERWRLNVDAVVGGVNGKSGWLDFNGDGSRGGPARRELTVEEKEGLVVS